MVKKNKQYSTFLCVAYLVSIIACTKPAALNVKEYTRWIEQSENGMHTSKKVDDFEFALLYKPVDYLLAMDLKSRQLSKADIQKKKESLKGYQYYTFRIRSTKDNEFFRTGITDENQYYERLEYFVSNAQNDIMLVEGTDTIPCAVYHFERNYGVSPYNNIVLSFEERDSTHSKDKVFIYDDKVLGLGKIAIGIQTSDIKDLPKLNI